MFQGCDGRVCDVWSLQSSNCLLPSFVCCLSRLLNIQLCRGLFIVVKGAEKCGSGVSMTAVRRVSRWCSGRRPAQTASWISAWMRGLAAAWSRNVTRSFVPDSSAECCLRQTVLRESSKEALERPLPNLFEDFSSPFLLQDRVAVHSQDVVDAANSHCSNDIRLGRELIRYVLSRSDSHSKCYATSVTVEMLAMFCTPRILHSGGAASKSFTKWMTSVSSGFRSAPTLQKRQHQGWVTHDVTVVHVPLICQASFFVQRVPRVVGSGKLLRAAKLEVGCFLHSGCVVCLQSLFF